MSLDNKICIRHKKRFNVDKKEQFMINFEEWVAYWRANPHRFITEYLGLKLYDFQKVIIWFLFQFPKDIMVASRGLNFEHLDRNV